MVPAAEFDAVVHCHSTSRRKYFTAVIKEYHSTKAGLITWVYYNSKRRILQEIRIGELFRKTKNIIPKTIEFMPKMWYTYMVNYKNSKSQRDEV